MKTDYPPQYWQLCVTCQAVADAGERQCSYCKGHRKEQHRPRLDLHFSISQPARRDRIGRRIGRPSWDVFLERRRVAHVYHNRREWIYSFADNPYRLFSCSGKSEQQVFAAIDDHIEKNPAVLKFWISGGGALQYLDCSDGSVAAIVPVAFVNDPRWRVKMLITKRGRDFANAREGVEWAKKVALRLINSPIPKGKRT